MDTSCLEFPLPENVGVDNEFVIYFMTNYIPQGKKKKEYVESAIIPLLTFANYPSYTSTILNFYLMS